MAKAGSKKAEAKTVSAEPLVAIRDGSHMIDGVTYAFKSGEAVIATAKHAKALKALRAFGGH
jgi:hypothetical protein